MSMRLAELPLAVNSSANVESPENFGDLLVQHFMPDDFPCVMVNVDHPCYALDTWLAETASEADAALRQGYIPIDVIRKIVNDNILLTLSDKKS